MTKTTQETGRSMVEMLGVLAVIGVLSVGGISGYTQAMNKHRANNVAADLMKRAMVISAQRQLGQVPNVQGLGNKVGDYTIDQNVDTSVDGKFAMTVQDVPQEVCKKILALDWDNATISPDTAEECNGEDMTFTYNNDLSPITNSGSTGGEGTDTPQEPICEEGSTGNGCQKCDENGNMVADTEKNGQSCELIGNTQGTCVAGECCPGNRLSGDTCCDADFASTGDGCVQACDENDFLSPGPGYCCVTQGEGVGYLAYFPLFVKDEKEYVLDPSCGGCPNGPDGEAGELTGESCCWRGMKYNIGDLAYTDWDPQVCGCPEVEAPEGGTPLAYNEEANQCCVNGYSYHLENGLYDLFSPDICGCPYKDYESGMMNIELQDYVNCCSYQTGWIGLWNPNNGYAAGQEGYEEDIEGVCP